MAPHLTHHHPPITPINYYLKTFIELGFCLTQETTQEKENILSD